MRFGYDTVIFTSASGYATVMPVTGIALVEDERILREELAFQLGHMGFAVEAFEDASQLYRRLAVHRFAVVVLDIGLRGENGLSICSYLREHDRQVGIVFVTARALRDDRLTGLHAGADAYLSKPVDIDELSLVLQRLVDRREVQQVPVGRAQAVPASNPDWQLDGGSDSLLVPGGQRVRLSANEVRILRVFLGQPGETVAAPELAVALGQLPEEYDKHRLEVIISRLRDKVLRETGSRLPVVARRGIGYVFLPDCR